MGSGSQQYSGVGIGVGSSCWAMTGTLTAESSNPVNKNKIPNMYDTLVNLIMNFRFSIFNSLLYEN
jgi:hypothetical protein